VIAVDDTVSLIQNAGPATGIIALIYAFVNGRKKSDEKDVKALETRIAQLETELKIAERAREDLMKEKMDLMMRLLGQAKHDPSH
jgi:hypothetical protein